MSHIDAGPLPAYNSLMDPHLAGYFGNRKMRRHLRKQGLITRNGDIVSENTYRLNMARKEHKKHVRDMLAQAIVHKTLDMERARQVQIKRKLEEIAKIELVRRVQGERGRKGDEDILPYLTKGELDEAVRNYRTGHQRIVRPASVPSRGRRGRGAGRPVSAPGRSTSRKGKGSARPGSFYVDEDGFPVSANERPQRSQSAHVSRRKTYAKYPTDELDDRHLYALNQHTLHEYTQLMNELEQGRGPSPYTLPQLPMMESMTPRPPGPPKSNCPIKKSRRRIQHTDALGRPIKYKDQNKGYLLLHRTEPAMKHQERVQTLCDVSMHYFGSNLKLDYERTDPRDEVMIEQQHCGGNTLVVFREHILPHSDFTFTSRRHRGYPFSLTFYINGVQDCRLSTCCEYKHGRGSRLGGKAGRFAVLGIQGAAPCYRCQINESMKDGGKKKKKKDKKGKKDEEDKENENEDKSGSEDDEYDEDFSEDETEDEETKKEEEVDVRGMTDDEDKDKYDYSSDEEYDDKKGNDSDASSKSSRSSRSSKSSRSSRSRSRSSSRSRSRSSSKSGSDDEKSKSKKSSETRNSDSDISDSMRPVSRIGHTPYSDSDSPTDSDASSNRRSSSGKKKKKSPPDSARSSSSTASSSSTPRNHKEKKQKADKKKGKKKDDSSDQDSEIEKSMAVVRATVKTLPDSDDDAGGAQSSHPGQAEVYERKHEELETTKESEATNQSGDSNEREVKEEMQKVLENTTQEAVSPSSESESKSDSSDSSSDSSESESEQKTKSKEASKNQVSATDTGGFDSSDYHGGHDPDRVAAGEGSAAHLSTIGVTPGEKHDGSIKPLLESQTNVELTSIALDSNQVDELCDHLASVEEAESLVLRNTSLMDESIAKISKSLKQSSADFKMVNLNLNNITDSGVHSVVDIIRSKPNLEILLLHGNPLGDAGIEKLVTGLEEIAEERARAILMAAKNITAEALNDALQSSSLGSVVTQGSDGSNGSQTAALLAAIESQNRGSVLKLQQLDIGDCRMTDVGARHVAKLVEMNVPITNLSLSGNKGITSDGWSHIADALKRNTVITTLSLDYNNLGDDSARYMAEALRENKTLVSLDLEGNKIGQAGAQSLLSSLRQNKGVQDITLMPGNRIDDQALQDIKTAISR